MKKMLIALLAVLLLLLAGCHFNKPEQVQNRRKNDGMFSLVYNDGWLLVYVDNRTGVQYLYRSGGGVCVVVDENGKPLLLEEP